MATETGEITQVAVETFPKKKSFFEREWWSPLSCSPR